MALQYIDSIAGVALAHYIFKFIAAYVIVTAVYAGELNKCPVMHLSLHIFHLVGKHVYTAIWTVYGYYTSCHIEDIIFFDGYICTIIQFDTHVCRVAKAALCYVNVGAIGQLNTWNTPAIDLEAADSNIVPAIHCDWAGLRA